MVHDANVSFGYCCIKVCLPRSYSVLNGLQKWHALFAIGRVPLFLLAVARHAMVYIRLTSACIDSFYLVGRENLRIWNILCL